MKMKKKNKDKNYHYKIINVISNLKSKIKMFKLSIQVHRKVMIYNRFLILIKIKK